MKKKKTTTKKTTKKTEEKEQQQEEVKEEKRSAPVESMSDMDDNLMNELLIALVGTETWIAIQRYNSIKCIEAENALCSIDPFQNPTLMARNQGFRQGILKLESHIKERVAKRKKVEEEEAARTKIEQELYGYNK